MNARPLELRTSAVRSGPAISRTVRTSEELALQWLAGESAAKLLVDPKLRVLWANTTALAWLQTRDCMSLSAGQLSVGKSQAQLRALIARADERNEGFCVPIENCGAHVIICAKRVSSESEVPNYGITARRTDEIGSSELFGVIEVFRLTQSEYGVLKLLAAGYTAQAISNQLGVSVETVRTHIRRLYTKLDVSSREGLFTRLRPFLIET